MHSIYVDNYSLHQVNKIRHKNPCVFPSGLPQIYVFAYKKMYAYFETELDDGGYEE